jgi:hypothetical protein
MRVACLRKLYGDIMISKTPVHVQSEKLERKLIAQEFHQGGFALMKKKKNKDFWMRQSGKIL